jgi:hypothetical protein
MTATATPNVDPESNPYPGKQYARCSSYGISRRGLFGDALAEVLQLRNFGSCLRHFAASFSVCHKLMIVLSWAG